MSERDGVNAIRITPEPGTVKTKQARVVPIHEHLIEQGLLEFVKSRGVRCSIGLGVQTVLAMPTVLTVLTVQTPPNPNTPDPSTSVAS